MTDAGAVTLAKQRHRSALENSALRSLSDEFTQSFEHSGLGRTCSRLLEITGASVIYRWLTAEPEPEVIVIDLRETYTASPFLAVIDAATPKIARLWRSSGFASAVRAIGKSLSNSTTAGLAAKLLEPPEPPENRERRE